jgi:hypothetical protein
MGFLNKQRSPYCLSSRQKYPNDNAMKNNTLTAGWYVGTCTNTTVIMGANLLLTIYGAADGTLHGEIALFGDLGGGGVFEGMIANNQIIFTTTMPSQQVAITWAGTISGSGLSGTYVVRNDHPDVDPTLRHQTGVWSCQLVRPLGKLSPDEVQSVWVYHGGNVEGPFNFDDFNQYLAAGRWPANAIVRLDDRTLWLTTTACLEKIRADAAALN